MVLVLVMRLTCPSPGQSNFPRRVDWEPCSPCYTSLFWEENHKRSSIRRTKILLPSSCWCRRNLLSVAVPLGAVSWLMHDWRARWKGFLLQGFPRHLPVLLCRQQQQQQRDRLLLLLFMNSKTIWPHPSAWALHALRQTGSLSESEPAPNVCTWKAAVWLRFSCAPVFKVCSWVLQSQMGSLEQDSAQQKHTSDTSEMR